MKSPVLLKILWFYIGFSGITVGCVNPVDDNPLHLNPLIIIPGSGKAVLLQPNGEEQWFIGSEQEIVWDPGVVPEDTTVTLLLSLDGGNNYAHTIVSDTPNDGTFTWTVPDFPSKSSLIQVEGPVSKDISDTAFFILRKPDPKQVTSGGGEWPSWRSDRLAFMSRRYGNWDIFVTPIIGSSPVIQVTTDPADDQYPNFDNKGFHLTFSSDRTGREEIWATTQFFDRKTDKIQLTNNGGTHPTWRPLPTSQELAYLSFTAPGLFNISTIKFVAPLGPMTNIPTPILLVDNSNKARPSWIIESSGINRIYYKDFGERTGPNAVKSVIVNDGFNIPKSIVLPFSGVLVRNPSVSPSGGKMAFTIGHDIWVVDMIDGQPTGKPLQVTFDAAMDDYPDLHSDIAMAFQSDRTGQNEIWWLTLP